MVRSPHPSLRALVRDYIGYAEVGLAPGLHHGLPSTELTGILSFDRPLDVAWLDDDGSRGTHWAMVSGLHTRPAAIRHDGSQRGVQLSLTPLGARVLLGMPAGDLARALVPLDDVVGQLARHLYDDLAGAATWPACFDALDRHLLALAGHHDTAAVRPEVAWAFAALRHSHGAVPVAVLADRVGWSRRHLTGQFIREIGLAPKEVGRIARFEHARTLLPRPGQPGLAHVATAAGYADQSHLNREWRALAGCSPSAWMEESFSFVQDTQAVGS